MNSQDFLKGYFFAACMLAKSKSEYIQKELYNIDINLMFIEFVTQHQGSFRIGMNRGISPIGGRVAFCANELNEAEFSIVDNWIEPSVWTMVLDKVENVEDKEQIILCGEARVSFTFLCELIDQCGGIDWEQSVKL
jgi:hypothetical protein